MDHGAILLATTPRVENAIDVLNVEVGAGWVGAATVLRESGDHTTAESTATPADAPRLST